MNTNLTSSSKTHITNDSYCSNLWTKRSGHVYLRLCKQELLIYMLYVWYSSLWHQLLQPKLKRKPQKMWGGESWTPFESQATARSSSHLSHGAHIADIGMPWSPMAWAVCMPTRYVHVHSHMLDLKYFIIVLKSTSMSTTRASITNYPTCLHGVPLSKQRVQHTEWLPYRCQT